MRRHAWLADWHGLGQDDSWAQTSAKSCVISSRLGAIPVIRLGRPHATLDHRYGMEVASERNQKPWPFVSVFSLAIMLAVYTVFILWFLPWL